ncbi:MAG: hypothetical protein A3D31_14920 [Candidatus Fluviicola riflensis]|nr:MAG: hypothetical protein CHH17_19355 [Candidatus Fluviicola riflensis]OGS78256.1 MAG: hypothetical protein A3D31_14920 [Candidatus Fluviicola riflensis]OGS85322.1 MAG: hypothetical protein A2724_11855 [Fluviicola sp. RIFCSPHIGHO2_01_FULL_43_53]OGS87364.1 MAG: hypothetical protein A3E30_08275 [Fluviicola sp. RIFCSPHIGHO2_12_FULL_43_24]
MTNETSNALDPILDLTYQVREGVYTYYLKISVPGECLNVDSPQLIDDPVMIAEIAETVGLTILENEVNDVVTLRVLASGECDDPNAITLEITNNEAGKPGNILVLVGPPPTSNYSHSPQTDGKAIIRFEKARP